MTSSIPRALAQTSDDPFREWLNRLAAIDIPGLDIDLPRSDALGETLRYLDVPAEAIPEIAQSRPDRERHPDAWWILQRCVSMLVAHMGEVRVIPPFPEFPHDVPDLPPHLFIHVFTAMVPHVRAYHRSRGIDDAQSRAILGDIGRNVRVHEKRYGGVGLGVVNWITLHVRGLIYDLGRLQFERAKMRHAIADALMRRGIAASPDETVLSIHIPDFKGAMTPEACDSAIASARQFFAEHFPEERYRYAVCHSWLLDPQLKRYLRPDANIVHFQNRFELAERLTEADHAIVQFVFGPVPADPADLPDRTSLERAVREHLVAGEHWHVRNGWFAWS